MSTSSLGTFLETVNLLETPPAPPEARQEPATANRQAPSGSLSLETPTSRPRAQTPPSAASSSAASSSAIGSSTDLDAGPVPALTLVDELLRDRTRLLDRLEKGLELGTLARAMLLTVGLTAAAFGATMGLSRGGWQVPFAALKFPALLLLTAAICAPAYSALKAGVQAKAEPRRDFALLLASLALGCMVITTLTPLVMLAICFNVDYHRLILLVVGCCGLSGLAGLSLFLRGMSRDLKRGKLLVGLSFLAIVGLVGSQLSWTLRPYVVRPRSPEVVFLRSLEDDFFSAVLTTLNSANGEYRSEASLPVEVLQEAGEGHPGLDPVQVAPAHERLSAPVAPGAEPRKIDDSPVSRQAPSGAEEPQAPAPPVTALENASAPASAVNPRDPTAPGSPAGRRLEAEPVPRADRAELPR